MTILVTGASVSSAGGWWRSCVGAGLWCAFWFHRRESPSREALAW